MAKFEKGLSGNPGGRGKGTPNRTTKEAKEILNQILFAEVDNIRDALNKIRRKDSFRYLDTLTKLLPFCLPRKTDLTSDDEPIQPVINITVASQKGADELKAFLDGTPSD
jgi:hypothetical protein